MPLQLSNPAPQIADAVVDPHANLKPAGLDCSTQVGDKCTLCSYFT